MRYLFFSCKNFNEDISAMISAWDIRRAEDLSRMFHGASSFNQPLGAWAVRPGADTYSKFGGATAFDWAANAPWLT